MQENKKFKLVASKRTRYLLPNILTIGGVCLGISSIKFSIEKQINFYIDEIIVDNENKLLRKIVKNLKPYTTINNKKKISLR